MNNLITTIFLTLIAYKQRNGLIGGGQVFFKFCCPNFCFLFSYFICRFFRFNQRTPPKLSYFPVFDIDLAVNKLFHFCAIWYFWMLLFSRIRYHDNSTILPFGLWFICFIFLFYLFSFVLLQIRMGEVSFTRRMLRRGLVEGQSIALMLSLLAGSRLRNYSCQPNLFFQCV